MKNVIKTRRISLLRLLCALALCAGTGLAEENVARVAFHLPEVRGHVAAEFAQRSRTRRRIARQTAQRQGWQPRGRRDHTVWQVMTIDGDFVYAYKTLNANAAISVAIPDVREARPYGLTGAGQTVGLWDGGTVRAGHQEFGTRVDVVDSRERGNHSTHVAGTIGSGGVVAASTGMAPNVRIDSYDSEDDLSEMTLVAMSSDGESDKLQISNHSYGTVCGWNYTETIPRWYGRWPRRESDVFGKYDSTARDMDELCYDAPY